VTLQQTFPDAESMLPLEPEELGAALLEILGGSQARFSQAEFTGVIGRTRTPQWPQEKLSQVRYAIAEAFAWLERAGLIMEDFTQTTSGSSTSYRLLTRRGRELRTREETQAYRDAAVLPVGLMHPDILSKAHPPFLRGDYEVAVFAAMRAVEVAVRKAGGFPDDELGVPLMRKAFDAETGPLSDKTIVVPERQATAHLFAGAIGAAKNPPSHREIEMNRVEAARLILFASHLMSIVDNRSPK
jgi:uncharacterized protein (TIGR02391 family)